MDIKIIYLISNNNIQLLKIKNAEILEKTLAEEHDLYKQISDTILSQIIDKNFVSNKYLNSEIKLHRNIVNNINKEIMQINIENILSNREITEIDNLKLLSTELYDNLIEYNNKHFICVLEYKYIKFIKILINKEKIHKKIYFISDFGKPISYMIKEFIAILD